MVFGVLVAVALGRPPGAHAHRRYLVEAPGALAARLLACQWAASSPGVVMPVWASEPIRVR